jgi:hypothetical protein
MSQEASTTEQQTVEVEIIAPPSSNDDPDADPRTKVLLRGSRRHVASKRSRRSRQTLETEEEQNSSDSESVTDFSTQVTKNKNQEEEDDKKYCEFCGAPLEEQFGAVAAQRRKYCSAKCRSIATGRRTRARLGVRPTRHEVSKLNPLYFN